MLLSSFEALSSEPIPENHLKNKTSKGSSSTAISSCTDIQSLFTSFNKRFFWSCLNDVEVIWSNRMTSSAGLCYYKSKLKQCCIRLSSPLLKLRPHSDVVDTLLHEMIHAYLFLTSGDSCDDRDGHGLNFHKHKNRINKRAGTNITVYHSFHSEVKLYKQHWWRCNGPCQLQSPYFGMIKRTVNRPPDPYDFWWNRHKARCSGIYVKIREPIEYTKQKNKDYDVKGQGSEKTYGLENVTGYIDLTHLIVPGAPAATRRKTFRSSLSSVLIDLTEEPKAKKSKTDNGDCMCPVCNVTVPRLSVADHLESCDGMQSIFDFDIVEDDSDNNNSEDVGLKETGQSCPICSCSIEGDLKSHVDDCLNNSGIVNILYETNKSKCNENGVNVVKEFKNCPICNMDILNNFEDHVDNCLNNSINEHDLEISDCELPEKSCDMQTKVPKAVLHDSSKPESVNVTICPVCCKRVEINIEVHVNVCLNSSMSSSDFDETIEVVSESPHKIDLTQIPKAVNSSKTKYAAGSSKSESDRKIHPSSKKNTKKALEDHNSPCFKLSSSSDDSIGLAGNKSPEKLFDSQNRVSKTVSLMKSSAILDLTDSRQSCPVCAKFINGDMNSHIDKCLNTSCTVVDFDDSIIMISDSESPVKVVNSNAKIPLPKTLHTCDNNSESRVACRICGMKFGVSKFNGHVCYER